MSKPLTDAEFKRLIRWSLLGVDDDPGGEPIESLRARLRAPTKRAELIRISKRWQAKKPKE